MDERTTFNTRGGTGGDQGHCYERKLIMYALLQCLIGVKEGRISTFQLARNVDGAGAFDDVVLLYEYVSGGVAKSKKIFIQTKHKDEKGKEEEKKGKKEREAVKVDSLLQGSVRAFSLLKYLKSHLEIVKKNVLPSNGDCAYVIYSNWPLDAAPQDFEEVHSYSEDEPIDLVTCDNCDRPNVSQCSHIFHKFASIEKLKQFTHKCDCDEKVVDDFRSRLRLQFAQLGERRLGELIKLKMKSHFSHWSKHSVELIFSEVNKRIEDWWRYEESGRTTYLTEADDLFERSYRRLEAKTLSRQARLEEALKLCKFREESLAELNNALAKGSSAVNVLVRRETNVLVVMKALQTLGDDCFFCDVSDDRSVDDAALDIFENDCKYLILNFVDRVMSDDTLDKLCRILRKERKVVVFIMQSDFDDLKWRLLEKFEPEYCEIVDEKVNLSDLDDESASKIDDYNVIFQGEPTKVGSISWDDSHTFHVLVSAVEDKPIVIGEPLEIPNITDTYVEDRKLEKVVLKRECLLNSTLTLAISGWEDVKDFKGFFELKADRIDNNVPLGTNKFLISHYKDFEKVCSLRNEVHWLKIKKGKLLWVKSKGAIKGLRRYISESPSAIDWQEIVENLKKLTIVSAEPGMGKSTLFDAMSKRTLRHREKMVWKIRIDLIYKKKEIKETTIRENVFEFLRDHMKLKTQMEKASFRHYFNEGKIVVMLDGYDEVSAVRRSEIDRLIEIFAEHDSLSVIIATRTHETAHLEDKFNTFAKGLKTFTRNDGILFLEKFFGVYSEPREEYDVKALYDHIMATFGMPFVENPLHLSMAAEYFVNRKKERSIDVLSFRPNILHLFRYFVDKKIEIYCAKKGNIKNEFVEHIFMREMNAHHRIMALGALFENDHLRLLFENKEEALLDEKTRQQWLEMGIVRGFAGDEAVFVHRTYAEYFAAMRLVEMCADEHRLDRLRRFLKAIRFYGDRHDSLRKFFDWAVVEKGNDERSLACHEAVLKKDDEALKLHFADRDRCDKCGRTPLHLAITYTPLYRIREFVEAGFFEQQAADRLFGWRPLTVAVFFAKTIVCCMLAACRDDGKVAADFKALLDYVGDDVEDRRRLLAFAAKNDLVDLARVLLAGYESLVVEEYNRLLCLCVIKNSVNFARFLKAYRIEIDKELILQLSIKEYQYDVLKQTEKWFEVPTKNYERRKGVVLIDCHLRRLMQTFKKYSRNKEPLAESNDMESVHNDLYNFNRSFRRPIDEKTTLVCNIDHLLENDERFIIIYGEKGIGKTTVLVDIIANRAMAFERVKMIEWRDFHEEAAPATCEQKNSLLLLDNIDACNVSNVDTLLELASRFRKVLATSRRLDEALEKRIGDAFAYVLEPFSLYAQKQLLRQAWSERLRPMNYTKTKMILENFLYSCELLLDASFSTNPAPLLALATYFDELFAGKGRGEVESMLVQPHRYMNVGRLFEVVHSGDQVAMKAMKVAAIENEFGYEFARRMIPGYVKAAASSSRSSGDALPFEGYLIATAVLQVLERIGDAEMLKKIAPYSMRGVRIFDLVFVSKLPLHYEVMMENTDEIIALLDAAPDPKALLDARDALGRTPLHIAVCYFKYGCEIIDLLVERGADPAAEDRILRWHPLCYAIYLEHKQPIDKFAALESYDGVFEVAKRVRQSVAIDDNKRLSIAHQAIGVDCTAVVDAMIDDGEKALANASTNYYGTTLLHVAVKYGSARTAELLVTRKGAHPFAADEDGKSVLERARARNEGDETRLLFERLYPIEEYFLPRPPT